MHRSPYPRMVVTFFALLGLFDSIYLSLSRVQSVTMACPIGGGCDIVQASAWSTFPPGTGVPVAFMGVAGYLALFVLGMLSLQRDRVGTLALPLLLLLLSSGGFAFSIYLFSVQLFLIGSLCFWCTLSAIFEAIIWTAALVDWRAWKKSNRVVKVQAGKNRRKRKGFDSPVS